ncbi:hypothetical protein HOY82DRAFT_597842 [Tuber indicum]|nr:hypothetical protein HOY82DRAFT_597842 [Tuber indicum]
MRARSAEHVEQHQKLPIMIKAAQCYFICQNYGGSPTTYSNDWATMSHSDITIRYNAPTSCEATLMVIAEVVVEEEEMIPLSCHRDLQQISQINFSPSPTRGGDGAGNNAARGQPELALAPLSLIQLKRLVVEAAGLTVCLIKVPFCLMLRRRVSNVTPQRWLSFLQELLQLLTQPV